jgi:ribosomal protein S18 acetylase RimI-like enzyme
MSDYPISFMEQGDIREAVSVLSHAMLNNPLHVALLLGNGERQRRAIERMFLDLFNTLPGIVFIARKRRKIVGVMRMKSCVGRQIEADAAAPTDPKDIESRKSIWRREWAVHDPVEQHWHLGPIGVLPGHQKRGVGSRLMQRFCSEVDACRATAYLETDLDENVRFYGQFGFEVVSRSDIFQVENRYMVRPGLAG